MDFLMKIERIVNGFVWGPPILLLVVGTGLYITFRTKFFTVRKLGYVFSQTIGKMFKKDEKTDSKAEGEITPFQAMSTALAATLGTGNIAGVATALTLGGPGAIFWMWVSALFGMATKYSEVVLAVNYREDKGNGVYVGGPMYYLKNGLKQPVLAAIFAVFTSIAALGTGNMVQSNSVAQSLNHTFGISETVTGIVLAIVVGLAMLGGLKRIASITEKLVPFMAIFYIAGALLVVLINITAVPAALALIVKSAFTGKAAFGGFAGATMALSMRFGIARGVFSNEAGLGSAPIAHAPATTDSPVKQGFWGVFEVFVSSMIICTLTALTILVTDSLGSGKTAAALTTLAFEKNLGTIGGYIVSFGLLFFALSTLLGWSYYGEVSLSYLFGEKVSKLYKFIWIPLVFVGAIANLEVVWNVSDTFNGLMAIPNLIGVLGLSKVVISLTKEYFDKVEAEEKAVGKEYV